MNYARYFSVLLRTILCAVQNVSPAILAVLTVLCNKKIGGNANANHNANEGTAVFFLELSVIVVNEHVYELTKRPSTSVTGDLGLTLRAAAISCSWLTSSVMDSRSSGFTFSMDAERQEVERDQMIG